MLKPLFSLYRNAFSGLSRDVWLLSLIAMINRAGTMVFPFLTLYFVNHNGFTRSQAGFLLLAFGSGSLIGSYVGGMLCGRLGPIRVLMASLCSSGIAFLLFPLVHGYYGMMAGCVVVGMLGDAFRPAIMTAVSLKARPENQTRAFALLRMALHVGIAVGPAVAGVLAGYNYNLLFVGEGVTCLLAGLLTPVLLPFLPKSQRKLGQKEKNTEKLASPLKDGMFMAFMLVLLIYAIMLFQFFGVYPLYLNEHYGLPEGRIGLILGFNALFLVIFEMVVVHLLEDWEPIILFGLGSIVVGLGWALLPFGDSFQFALFCMLIFTFGEMITLPFSNTLVALRAGKASGPYMGVYTAMFSAATMIGPPVGLFLYGIVGGTKFWLMIGAMGFLIWSGCLLLIPAYRIKKKV